MGLQPQSTARAKEQYAIPLSLVDTSALLESFADPVLLMDAESDRILGWSKRALELCCFPPEELLRGLFLDLFSPASRSALKKWFFAAAPGSLEVFTSQRNAR